MQTDRQSDQDRDEGEGPGSGRRGRGNPHRESRTVMIDQGPKGGPPDPLTIV